MKFKILFALSLFFLATACEDFDVENLDPDRSQVITDGSDLQNALTQGYIAWWIGTNNPNTNLALGVAADAYGLGRDEFAAHRIGQEPRPAYSNRVNEPESYRSIVEIPWFRNLTAVSNANDVLVALANDVSIDGGGPQDQSVAAAAHLLRGLVWGYLGLLFDQAPIVTEGTNLDEPLEYFPYEELIAKAVEELGMAIAKSEVAGFDFVHNYFNGTTLTATQFQELCHSFTARFLAQAARTANENDLTDWQAVLNHAEQGLTFDFAPEADGQLWTSYHAYTFAETQEPPFWARVDQRLVAALDHGQPTRYPVNSFREKIAESPDARLETDFEYFETVNFDTTYGWWHFSHYKHQRNTTQPDFAGDGQMGKMPTFLAADNALLQAEASLMLNRKAESIDLVNNGTRISRGNLPPLATTATVEEVREAIFYERMIELFNSAPFGIWLDRRRVGERLAFDRVDAIGSLQSGTLAQLPVPAVELLIKDTAIYTFGGPSDSQGVQRIFY